MKKGLEVYSSVQVGSLRLALSFIILLPVAFHKRSSIRRRDIPWLAVVGWSGSGFPAFLFALAQTHISSGVAGILNSLTPLFTLVLGMTFFGLPFRWSWVAGIGMGLTGVLLIIGQINGWAFGPVGWYALAALSGTVFYALSGNTVKARLAHLDAMTIGSIGFVWVGIPALLILAGTDFTHRIMVAPGSLQAFGAICLLALLGTVFASVLYYHVVQKTNQVFASMVSYLIPLIALAWGFADGESIHTVFLAGLVLILAGVYLTRNR